MVYSVHLDTEKSRSFTGDTWYFVLKPNNISKIIKEKKELSYESRPPHENITIKVQHLKCVLVQKNKSLFHRYRARIYKVTASLFQN